ncbi:ribosome recycling factor [Bacteroidetes bacterium endosymbiont of Geopemphigus sp.]|uniref:ribosome recycling factor n=1 Tax=Bacteroidetes bacterium endosymbiont of Geopemphigus sp. TaxID=2047937 RepID=UPI000CD02ED4|nr:ribosome recycling factor [Bacteroidetes bacterium endosymbiont of Geopemphigus sp.]
MEKLEEIILEGKEEMEKSLERLRKAFSQIRTGKASPHMLEAVKVEYYGVPTPLNQVANISVMDAVTLSIQPWERNMLSAIDRAIINANIGFTPMSNGEAILIHLPPLTEERRKELVKRAKAEKELSKVSLRNIRKEANQHLKKIEALPEDSLKIAEERIQKITDAFVKKTDELFSFKEREILTV